ncbi:hypothetical protein RJT34_25654 [Clitoria ternatea]|uniref:Protein kinase domain-containing protein n=1 Tax=Clitoria ternatea TaxID=43366 RepID=A0AAN9FWK9_CLITE
MELSPHCIQIPSSEADVWELDTNQLKYENKVGSGSFGDLYKDTYYGQDVAIKIRKPERISTNMLREFAHEVYIMSLIIDDEDVNTIFNTIASYEIYDAIHVQEKKKVDVIGLNKRCLSKRVSLVLLDSSFKRPSTNMDLIVAVRLFGSSYGFVLSHVN